MRDSRSFVVWDALPDAAAAISVVNAGSFYSPDEPGRRSILVAWERTGPALAEQASDRLA
jgi:hypothetical protein